MRKQDEKKRRNKTLNETKRKMLILVEIKNDMGCTSAYRVVSAEHGKLLELNLPIYCRKPSLLMAHPSPASLPRRNSQIITYIATTKYYYKMPINNTNQHPFQNSKAEEEPILLDRIHIIIAIHT